MLIIDKITYHPSADSIMIWEVARWYPDANFTMEAGLNSGHIRTPSTSKATIIM